MLPGVVVTGRSTKASNRHDPVCPIARTPSKLKGTFGPSRSEYIRPDPTSISWRPPRTLTATPGSLNDLELPKPLMQIQLVFLGDGLRAADATVLERAVQLGPQSQTRAQVNVRMQQVSLQEVSVRTRHAYPKVLVAKPLVRLARLPAE